jgi:hypothetical protein
MSNVQLKTKPVTDYQDLYNSAAVTASAGTDGNAPVTVVSDRVRVGSRAFLAKLGNAIQAGGENYVTFRLLLNGSRLWPYDGSQNQWGDPANLQDLPARLELPQGAMIQIQCDNSDPSNAYVATARLFIEYEDF